MKQIVIRINDIIETVQSYQPTANIALITQAYVYTARYYHGRQRQNKEPYIHHPLNVAKILADLYLDVNSIAAGLIHALVEEKLVTQDEIKKDFGNDIANLVVGVTEISAVSRQDTKSDQADIVRRMILASISDLRILFLLLADRLQNMRSLDLIEVDLQDMVARETMDIYAPIASRLGMYRIKKELEDLAFKKLLPDEYDKIDKSIIHETAEREKFIEHVRLEISQKMNESNIEFAVSGRFKHHYSIYQKMQRQNLPFEQIYDVVAFRIIVNTDNECYETLGLVHSMWKPIQNRIKDYIAFPKINGYKSLHTTVIGPFGRRIEIQIRTKQMDSEARSGIAAHWAYKEKKHVDQKLTGVFEWLQTLIEDHQTIQDPNEFLENIKINLFPDEVYVYTAAGDLKTLPIGSTPVDFAYAIHSDIGHTCIGVKINGIMKNLNYQLKSGDHVEILTSKNHHPSKDWIQFVKTGKARSKIRQWIKNQERERSIGYGKNLFEKECKKYKLNYSEVLKSDVLLKLMENHNLKTLDDLMSEIGYGKIIVSHFLKPLLQEPKDELKENKFLSFFKKRSKSGVRVQGYDDFLIRLGKCCNPLPKDRIVGYVTRGFGITVHKVDCVNALQINPERAIDVEWNMDDASMTYPVTISISAMSRLDLYAEITSVISKYKANIMSLKTIIDEEQMTEMDILLAVKDIDHLEKIIKNIKKLKNVHRIIRKHSNGAEIK